MYDIHCDYIIDIIIKHNKISIIKLDKISVKVLQVPNHYFTPGGRGTDKYGCKQGCHFSFLQGGANF